MMHLPCVRRLIPVLLLGVIVPVAGCSHSGPSDSASDVKVELSFDPNPPRVGSSKVVVRLIGPDGRPVHGAVVKLEGNMNHAGMEPVFADTREVEPGQYQAALDFTMRGDWFVLVTATLSDQRKVTRKIDVHGVSR